MTAMTIDSETHPAQADEVHDVEALLAVLHDLADDPVDLVEDAHAREDRPQHEDHDDAGDAEGDREQERDLHRRPRVDARDREPDPAGGCRARGGAWGAGGSPRRRACATGCRAAGSSGAAAAAAPEPRLRGRCGSAGTGAVGADADPGVGGRRAAQGAAPRLDPSRGPPPCHRRRTAHDGRDQWRTRADALGAPRLSAVLTHDLLSPRRPHDGTASVASSATPDTASPRVETASSPSARSRSRRRPRSARAASAASARGLDGLDRLLDLALGVARHGDDRVALARPWRTARPSCCGR